MIFKVVRIEHPEDGWGLFRSYDRNVASRIKGLEKFIERYMYSFPTPYDELRRWITDREFCAFHSVEQIKEWITPDEINVILNHKFKIYELELSDVIICEYQCFFKKEDIINKIDISDKFNGHWNIKKH